MKYSTIDNLTTSALVKDEFNGTNVQIIFDESDLNLFQSKKFKCDTSINPYPFFIYNKKQVNMIELITGMKRINVIYHFSNGNKYDLRKNNVQVFHEKHPEVMELYPDAVYVGGHINSEGKSAYILKNPIWKVTIANVPRLLMFCEPNAYCILCDKSYEIINVYENKCKLKFTWFIGQNGYVATHIHSQNNELESDNINKNLYMHQIIMNCYGNGRGTKVISVDHIDRNPSNNSLDNLRIATRKEQEQNTRGIIPDTKKERQCIARPLPEGIVQNMLRKYVVYNVEVYNKEKGSTREYFRVEHPKLRTPWESTSSGKVSIMDKLNEANRVAENLDNGILPERKERALPKYFTIKDDPKRGMVLTFDKKDNGTRLNYKMKMSSDSIEDELVKIKELIVNKYGSPVYESPEERVA